MVKCNLCYYKGKSRPDYTRIRPSSSAGSANLPSTSTASAAAGKPDKRYSAPQRRSYDSDDSDDDGR